MLLYVAAHHINDENKAATFMNNHVQDTSAFIMEIDGVLRTSAPVMTDFII